MPEDSHVRGSESPESTHLWKRRFVVLFVFKCIVHAGPIRVAAFFHTCLVSRMYR
jgi:hypothetical protein